MVLYYIVLFITPGILNENNVMDNVTFLQHLYSNHATQSNVKKKCFNLYEIFSYYVMYILILIYNINDLMTALKNYGEEIFCSSFVLFFIYG